MTSPASPSILDNVMRVVLGVGKKITMTIDTIIRTIQLMLAPVVMITACSTYITMLSSDYQSIVSSIRSMSREHLNLLQAASSSETGVSVSTLDLVSKERLHEIENE